ncbi:MAG TPA: phosphodiester glycosidase family protein [Stellaceae bacterium]
MDEFYSNGRGGPAPGGGPMYGNGRYGRDPQCSGTDRSYYDQLYSSTAIVLSVPDMQRLDRATGRAIWYRCGACADQAICWPRPGYDDLIAQVLPERRPPAPQPEKAPDAKAAADDIRRKWSTAPPLKSGVSYTTTIFKGQKLHAVKVTGGIRIGFSPNGKTLQGFVSDDPGATGAVTGTFSDWSPGSARPPNVGGPVVVGGKMVAPKYGQTGAFPFAPRSFLGYAAGSGFFVQEIPALPTARARQLQPTVEGLGAAQGLGGLGRLLKGGQDVHNTYAGRDQQFGPGQVSDTANARAVAGVADGGRTLVLLVEEGNGRPPTGAGLDAMAGVLKGLGVSDAVIMDGGGSAQIYIPGVPGANNHPNDARALPTAILF